MSYYNCVRPTEGAFFGGMGERDGTPNFFNIFSSIRGGRAESQTIIVIELPVLGLGLGVDFTFAWDNNNNINNNNSDENPHLNFLKGTVLGDKEQGVGIRDKGLGIRD